MNEVTFLGQLEKKQYSPPTVFLCAPRAHNFIFFGGFIMNVLKKTLAFVLVCAALATALMLFSCQSEPLVVKESDECIVIKTTDDSLEGDSEMLLITYMEKLKEEGELDFSVENGMVVAINGIENPADFSHCWMLYTSDAENANDAWGTVEYDSKTYGSAVTGAESLKIKPDQLYIWVYKAF